MKMPPICEDGEGGKRSQMESNNPKESALILKNCLGFKKHSDRLLQLHPQQHHWVCRQNKVDYRKGTCKTEKTVRLLDVRRK